MTKEILNNISQLNECYVQFDKLPPRTPKAIKLEIAEIKADIKNESEELLKNFIKNLDFYDLDEQVELEELQQKIDDLVYKVSNFYEKLEIEQPFEFDYLVKELREVTGDCQRLASGFVYAAFNDEDENGDIFPPLYSAAKYSDLIISFENECTKLEIIKLNAMIAKILKIEFSSEQDFFATPFNNYRAISFASKWLSTFIPFIVDATISKKQELEVLLNKLNEIIEGLVSELLDETELNEVITDEDVINVLEFVNIANEFNDNLLTLTEEQVKQYHDDLAEFASLYLGVIGHLSKETEHLEVSNDEMNEILIRIQIINDNRKIQEIETMLFKSNLLINKAIKIIDKL